MSKAIVSVLKQERRSLLKQLKPIDAALAKFGGGVKRRRKAVARKSVSAVRTANKTDKVKSTAKTEAEKLKEQIRAEKAKK